jgi:hypothetical protein
MRKLVILILVFSTNRVLLSCCKEDGYNFRWNRLDIINLDHSTDRPVPLAGTTATISNYGMRLNFGEERVARNKAVFSFNEAYAFDCRPVFQNRDSVTSINVITRQNFDNTHPAGSSVTEYLQARPTYYYQYYPAYTYKSLPEILSFINDSQESFIHNNNIDLKFQNTVPYLGQHRFVINVMFKSGRTLADSTEIIFN